MKNLDRRKFLKSVGTCALCSSISTLVLNSSSPVFAHENLTINKDKMVVDKDMFLKEKTVILTHPDIEYPISLLHLEGDNYSALLMMCTHQKCTTEWNKDHYVCPCHGARFTEKGEVIRGKAKKSLKSFPVKVTDNKVIVELT